MNGNHRSSGHRSGGADHRTGTGSHRVVRPDRVRRSGRTGRRTVIVLAGVGTGAAACALAITALLAGTGGGRDPGRVVGSGATESTPTAKGERTIVPDACALVGADLAGRLAPGAERGPADNYQAGERQNQCVWGAYTGDRKRQLTVELRAVAAAGGASERAAAGTFASERRDDESGKSLLAGQELTEKARLDGVGDEGYAVYSVDEGQGAGEAIANIRSGNVLVTIHYSGSDGGDPLAAADAVGGVTDVGKAVLQGLDQH